MILLAYTLVVVLMIVLPVALAAWLRRKTPVPWILFGLGSLTFLLSQVVHLPLNHWLGTLGLIPTQANMDIPLAKSALVLGLTAGVCEELARAGGYLFLQKARPGWLRVQDSLMLGLGHGGIEAMIVGGVITAATVSSLLPLVGVDLSTLPVTSPEQAEIIARMVQSLAGSPLNAGLPLVERLIALGAHVTFSVMVWKAFARGRFGRDWPYLLAAVLYHAGVDAAAVWGADRFQTNPWLSELVFIAVMIPGWAWALWQALRAWQPHPRAQAVKTGALEDSLRSELASFWTATAKELTQLWRTRRILVMGAVFLIFGMGSPLLAKLTPQVLQSIEGAEQFANLIPTPTGGDAMAQYIKNLTQFGFLLAVLLGMGVVVGEKERGVAPMILSKPMPRWAFISSKFAAQTAMYLGGFLLAGLGAYYYTIILFGSLDFGGFALMNGLLLLWLLTFMALSILGSTLGKSTVAAGGIGLALSVALLVAGSLPQYGAVLPSGLTAWAAVVGQAAAGAAASMPGSAPAAAEMAARGGSAAAALVVLVMSLVLAVGFFEQQEL